MITILRKTVALLLFFSFALIACKKSSSSTVTILGSVKDENNAPVENAKVYCGENSTYTLNDGTFSIVTTKKSAGESYVIKVNHVNHFTAYKNIPATASATVFGEVYMLSKTLSGTLSGGTGSITGTGYNISAQSGGFTTSGGSLYSGNVRVYARYIDANDTNLIKCMPGGDLSCINTDGTKGMMLSYGFITTEFTDATGNALTPNPSKVTIDIKVPNSTLGNPVSKGALSWNLDTTTGTWSDGKSLSQNGGSIGIHRTTNMQDGSTKPGWYLNINLDEGCQSGKITGKVDCSGTGQAGKRVYYINPYNAAQRVYTLTDGDGNYSLNVWTSCPGSGPAPSTYTITCEGVSVVAATPADGGTTSANIIELNGCSGGQTGMGSGTWIVDGVTHTTTQCVTTAGLSNCPTLRTLDIGDENDDNGVTIYNVPTAASGTYNMVPAVTNGIYANNYECLLHGGIYDALTGVGAGETISGTLTKTGPTSFTFNMVVVDYYGTNTHQFTVTGSGTYVEN